MLFIGYYDLKKLETNVLFFNPHLQCFFLHFTSIKYATYSYNDLSVIIKPPQRYGLVYI